MGTGNRQWIIGSLGDSGMVHMGGVKLRHKIFIQFTFEPVQKCCQTYILLVLGNTLAGDIEGRTSKIPG